MDNLPPLREVIETHDLRAKKSFGQNFLFDLNLTRKIARAVPDLTRSAVFEVGPGPGGLTRALLMENVAKLVSVEKDARCLPALAEIKAAYPDQFSYQEGDALEVNPADLLPVGMKRHIAANLPYNVGTALLADWMTVDTWLPWFSSLTLMFQKEVAERIIAQPGTKAYGRLAVLCQWRSEARKLFDVPAQAFTPPPKVTSAIVQIIPSEPIVSGLDVKRLEKFTAAAFGQRRKMMRASLKTLGIDGAALLSEAGLKETVRAEDLTVLEICTLAKLWQDQLASNKQAN